MKENEVEKILYEMRDSIPVNTQLQAKLKKEFIDDIKENHPGDKQNNRSNNKILSLSLIKFLPKIAAIVILSLGVYFLSGIIQNGKISGNVSAASLNVSNHVSFIDVDVGSGSPLGVSEYNGSLYIPVFGSGLYEYNSSGVKEIDTSKFKNALGVKDSLNLEVSWVRISPNGSKLVYSSTQGIGIYDIDTGESSLVIKSDDELTYYIEPSWHPDGNGILYTKQVIKPRDTHGFEIAESNLYHIDLKSMKSMKLADGTHGSYVKGKEAIIFERDGSIYYKTLSASGSIEETEIVVDQGKSPSVSPCGNYISYIKNEKTIKKVNTGEEKEIKEDIKAEIHESLGNIWITDVSNFQNKKQITTNYPYYFISEEDWLESLEPSDILQALSINGMYSYYNPVWSSDSKSIYAIKNRNSENANNNSKIIKIDLTINKKEKETIIERYLQALILRDDDYAKSLMKAPPELLTMSNPRYVGFRIAGSGNESGKEYGDYIDAEIYLSYTANPYYMIEKSRFYLSSHEDGYIIENINPIETLQIYERNGVVYLEKDVKSRIKLELFAKDDIPKEFLPGTPFRLSCLAYYNNYNNETKNEADSSINNDTDGTLIFTLQSYDDGQPNAGSKNNKPTVTLLSYSLKDKRFKLIDEISDPSAGVVCSNLTIDTSNRYAAVDVFLESNPESNKPEHNRLNSYTLVYDLNTLEKIDIFSLLDIQNQIQSEPFNLNSVFWGNKGLEFSLSINRQTMNYTYKPEDKKIEAY